jgi:hypothetical protein
MLHSVKRVRDVSDIVKGELFRSECQTYVKHLINQLTTYTLPRDIHNGVHRTKLRRVSALKQPFQAVIQIMDRSPENDTLRAETRCISG